MVAFYSKMCVYICGFYQKVRTSPHFCIYMGILQNRQEAHVSIQLYPTLFYHGGIGSFYKTDNMFSGVTITKIV